MNDLYPLLLRPLFQERVWGGQALRAFFGDHLPPGPVGEAWVCDYLQAPYQSALVAVGFLPSQKSGWASTPTAPTSCRSGPLAGASLTQLRRDYGPALLGTKAPATERFPLLIKLLDPSP